MTNLIINQYLPVCVYVSTAFTMPTMITKETGAHCAHSYPALQLALGVWLPQVLQTGQKVRQDLEYRKLYVRGAWLQHKAAVLLLPRRHYASAFLEKSSLLSRCEN